LHQSRELVRWRRLALLAHLSDSQYEQVCDQLQLVRAEPGTVICDEHEPAEAVYIVRNGLVRLARSASSLLADRDVCDWARLGESLGPHASGPMARLRQLLGEQGFTLDGRKPEEHQAASVVRALNGLLARLDLVGDAELALPAGHNPCADLAAALARRQELRQRGCPWPNREARQCNRLLLEALLPGVLRPLSQQAGLEMTLAYSGPGEWFGEQALLDPGLPAITATACGHPGDEGLVEVVRIPAATFRWVVDMCPAVRQRLEQEARRRQQQVAQRPQRPLWADTRPVGAGDGFDKLGLAQGQQLMLIDLDRCTRCNACVQACVDTHSDGLARLALDGPRLGRYLVPATCRACLDPVCLIGCPVGSIHRGDQRQIVIEDWCIGCGLCAERCPYGAIQMQDRGLLPEASAWRYLPVQAAPRDGWQEPGLRDANWQTGEAPFSYDREFVETLTAFGALAVSVERMLFRHRIHLVPSLQSVGYRLEVGSRTGAVCVFVNGIRAEPQSSERQVWATYLLDKVGPGTALRAGANVIAIGVELPGPLPTGELLLSVRLDEVSRPRVPTDILPELAEEVTEKQVTHRAATCDLCSGVGRGGPACVRVCPHDAALRVEARRALPLMGTNGGF
jgi:Fe-S-cluster-containing hydrogenase component 2/CRP-like cAMP-binding protein